MTEQDFIDDLALFVFDVADHLTSILVDNNYIGHQGASTSYVDTYRNYIVTGYEVRIPFIAINSTGTKRVKFNVGDQIKFAFSKNTGLISITKDNDV